MIKRLNEVRVHIKSIWHYKKDCGFRIQPNIEALNTPLPAAKSLSVSMIVTKVR